MLLSILERIMKNKIRATVCLSALLAMVPAAAQENDFLTDYSKLKAREGDAGVDRIYVQEGIFDRLQKYNAVMVDQPEVFISEETKYKGTKPDALKQLSDIMRMAMMERLEAGGYTISEQVGPGVLFMRWAITDLYLKKKKRGVLSFTPIGAAVHYSRQAAVKDLWKKIDIVEMGLELEFLDSVSEEQLAAATLMSGQRKDKKKDQEQDNVTWEELDAIMSTFGERVRCNLDNARLEEADRQDCASIVIEPVIPEEES
jgi:hypothetical protein